MKQRLKLVGIVLLVLAALCFLFGINNGNMTDRQIVSVTWLFVIITIFVTGIGFLMINNALKKLNPGEDPKGK